MFLCHSSSDKPVVRKLYQQLNNDGFDPWLDEEKLLPGQDWELEIIRAVRLTDIIIVCLSKGAISKTGFIQKEIKFALDAADMQVASRILCKRSSLVLGSAAFHLDLSLAAGAVGTVGKRSLFFHGFHSPVFLPGWCRRQSFRAQLAGNRFS